MDNYDDDIDWGDDDFFGGDMDFDDNFDMDPFKNKSFLAAATSGFLSGIVDGTVGSTDAAITTARTYLPSSFSTGLDRLRFLKDKGSDLIREFQEGNYETVKSLQSIAKTISGKITNENSYIKEQLENFSTKDFSSWEKYGSSDSERLDGMEEVSDEDITKTIERSMSQQAAMLASVGSGINDMAANVGGRTISAVMAGNRELIGIQSGLRELLDYQRRIQARMDATKVELLARTYMLNAKFYKFMEKGIHAEVKELKKIVVNTAMSDYEKTSHWQATKGKMRDAVLQRAGGILGVVRDKGGKEGREEQYNVIQSAVQQIASMLDMGADITPSWGMAGNMAGGMLSQFVLSELPRFFNQGPFQNFKNNLFKNNPEMGERFGKAADTVRNAGNKFSYNMNALPGMMQYYSQYWEDFDIDKYYDYDEYVEDMESQGKKPMPKAGFVLMHGMIGKQGKQFANDLMGGLNKAQGSRYVLRQRDAKNLTKTGIWKEINNITLVDIIPGLLRMQLESLEKLRTGNDSYIAPTYSFQRGQFISNKNAKRVVQADVFEHSSFSSAAYNANRLASSIDKNNALTPEERQQFMLKLVQDADKEYGFNPYYYTEGIGSKDDNLNERIGKMIRETFGIDDERLKEYDDADTIKKFKMASMGFNGDQGEHLNELGSLAQALKETVPNIQDNISASRSAGNDQILRELGIIVNSNGREQFNMDMFWQRMTEYLKNPDNIELRGDIDTSDLLHAGATQGGLGGSRRDSSNISKKSRKISNQADSLRDTAINTTQVLNDTMEKLVAQIDSYGKAMSKADFSNLQIDLKNIPDELTTIREVVEKMQAYDSRQESLLEQIAGCVCRTAGGWGGMDDTQKAETIKQENEGKKTLMERLREFAPKDLFNKGIETLINNQPLVLGGILGGLGVLAMHDPKAAMLISGGMVAAKIYSKIGEYARGRDPNNDEDILDEDGNIVLKSSKLRNGDYYDMVEKRVIKEWKEIKGALYDLANKTYVTIATLTGKLFGADGRAVIISGLSKIRDAMVKIWNKVDIFGHFGNALTKGKEMFYQQDVYVKGEKEPRLTRGGFTTGKYYCYDLGTREPFQIRGWNEIKGPVYELGPDGTLNQIISEADAAQGLVTSSGVAIDKLTQFTKWSGVKLLEGLGKAKDYSLEKAGLIKNKAGELFKNDYSGIESRLDQIYLLLCDKFGYDPGQFGGPKPENPDIGPKPKDVMDDIVDSIKTGQDQGEGKPAGINDPFNSAYPDKIRLNSFEDQEQKEEKKKRDDFYDDVAGIRERMDENAGKSGEDDKGKKKGLLGTIAGWLTGKDSFLNKLITNPIGFVVGGLVDNVLKAPGRLITMGGLLFKSVLGIGSPIYSILSWGFGGMMWGLRKLLFSNVESFADWAGGMRGRRRGRRRAGRRALRLGGRLGKVLMAGATAYGAYEGYQAVKGVMDAGSNARDILNGSSDEYDRFFGDPNADMAEEMKKDNEDTGQGRAPSTEPKYQSNLGEGMTTPEVIGTGAIAAMQAKGTAKTLGMGSLNPLAEAGAEGMAEKAIGKIAGRAMGKAAGKAIPLVGQALMAMDAYEGFTNKDEIGEIFNKNVINGRERLANGISNVLDLGGAISGTMNWAADKTGFESLRQEGGMTRFIDSALKGFTWGPLKYITPIGWLENWETEVSQTQNRVRLAMYGLKEGASELGRAIGAMEYRLNEFVKFNDNKAWFDEKAPIAEILNSFTTNNDPNETMQWFNLRFKPVYLTFQAGLRVVGFNSLQDFDRSKAPSVLKVIEQVRTVLLSVSPYPLDVVANIDRNNPIMPRLQTEAVITECMSILNDQYKDRGIDKTGLTDVVTKIKSADEYANGVATKGKEGLFDSVSGWLNKQSESVLNKSFPVEGKVVSIDISDLHKDQNTEVDLLTLVRLGCYGNVENNPSRVDAVLKLERYCESVSSFANGDVVFSGDLKVIFTLFKNMFRVTDGWSEEWMTWFNQRFLPVFKKWFALVYKYRRVKPADGWRSLTATNKHQIAFELTEVVVVIDNDAKSIWDISASPFQLTESGTDSSVVKGYLNNLEAKATEAKLKTPDLELEKSKPTDIGSSDGRKQMSKEREDAMMDRLLRGKKVSNTGKLYEPNVPLYTPTGSTPNNYSNTAMGALGQTNTAPGATQLSQLERDAGSVTGGGTNFSPQSLATKDGFKIDEKSAIKTIINEFVKQGITDNRVLAFALANAKSETGFQGSAESLNYSADRLPGIFKSTFGRNPALAQKYGRTANKPADQKEIANIAYGGKYGNKGGDDGWMYRGRGFTQLTFKGNYDAVGKAIGEDLASHPEKVTTDPITAAKSAAGFFKIHPEIAQYVQQGNIAAAAKVVGLHQEGIQNKVNFYPEFLKRLTEGDLKGILQNDKEQSGDQAGEGDDAQGGTDQVNQAPVSPVPGDPNAASAQQQLATDPTQQAANKVNAPPQNPDGSADTSATAPVPPPAAPADSAAPAAAPESTAAAASTAPSTSSDTSASTSTPPPVKQEPVKKIDDKTTASRTPSQSPDGVLKVSDAGVVSAIANLADIIQRSMNQSQLGSSPRVATD